MPPCPLYVSHETEVALSDSQKSVLDTGQEATWTFTNTMKDETGKLDTLQASFITTWNCSKPVEKKMLEDNIERFQKLWKLNVMTGEPISGKP